MKVCILFILFHDDIYQKGKVGQRQDSRRENYNGLTTVRCQKKGNTYHLYLESVNLILLPIYNF